MLASEIAVNVTIINEWYSTWWQWEDARDPIRNALRTIGQIDVINVVYVTSQFNDRKQQRRGDRSMGVNSTYAKNDI